MILPLATNEIIGYQANLVAGTLIGVGFGFTLERAGFGQAPVLAAQFYGSDTRVLKVMFSAIVTALVGMTVLSGVGLLDLSKVAVPETFLWPQIVGGLLLGVGFIVSGYCPGTSWVSAASGNLDGLATIGGVIAGSLGFGMAFPLFAGLYGSGAMGVVRLPDLLGVPQAVLAAAVAAMAVGAFLFGEWAERHFAARRGEEPPPSSPRTRNRVFAGFGVVAAVGLVTMAFPAPEVHVPEKAVASWDALALAKALIERPGAVQVVDLRPAAECEVKRIPGSRCLPATGADAVLSSLPPTRTLVLYGSGDVATLPAGVQSFGGEVATLKGGYAAFEREVLEPGPAPSGGTPAALADHRLRSALGAYFTGAKVESYVPSPARPVPAPAAEPVPSPAPGATPRKKGGGC
jgi:rhodanese-related sulfurtransferase